MEYDFQRDPLLAAETLPYCFKHQAVFKDFMDYYTSLAPSYDELHGDEQLRKTTIIATELAHVITPSTKLLDIGCGTGISLEPWNCRKIGVEPNKALAKIGRGKGFEIVDVSAEDMPFSDHEFDVVICVTSAHHFFGTAFEEIKRVGKNVFVFSVLKKRPDTAALVKKHFIVEKVVDDVIDAVLFCNTRKSERKKDASL